MVKDPKDNSPELDLSETIPVPSGELVVEPAPEAEPVFESTLTVEQIRAARKALRDMSFSGRNANLGKMINCPVHGFRHRQYEFSVGSCEQRFTNKVGGKYGYTQWREEKDPNDPEKVTLVPDLRTAIPHGQRGTLKQQVGAARFAKKRFHPHFSRLAHLLVARTREIFESRGFSLEAESEFDGETFKKNLHDSKVIAAKEIAKEEGINLREFVRRKLL